MLQITERLAVEDSREASATLILSYERRIKSRLRTILDDGREVGVILPRGNVLLNGDRLCTEDGLVVEVVAADESVSTAQSDQSRLLALACYHLGNRHMPLQIGDGWVRYQHDHVLDEMLLQLGLSVMSEQAPFEPESGAYGGHAFQGGDHGHGHHH